MADSLSTLAAARLELRQLVDDDVPDLFRVFSDARVMRWWSSEPLPEQAAARALLEDIERCRREDTLYQWGIVPRDRGRVVGTVTLSALDRRNRRAEVGFALHPDEWGRGLAREAVARLVAHAFDDLGLHRLEADVDPHNEPSLRLLEQLGFEREGYLRERWFVHGRWHDTVLLGRLARGAREPRGG